VITRCKVRCDKVSETNNGTSLHEAYFEAAFKDSKENKEFFAFTPMISISLGVVKEQKFVPGKEYYVDFIEAENA
jgi:hypothetical protein